MKLRPATLEDAEILLAWRNDPQTRAMSHNTHRVTWEEHLTWLENTLSNPDRRLYIAEVDGLPVGTVRADIGTITELSWTVAPDKRRNGYGKMMVCLAAAIHKPVKAEVKPHNIASARIAEAAGMLVQETSEVILFATPK